MVLGPGMTACSATELKAAGEPCFASSECDVGLTCDFNSDPPVCGTQQTGPGGGPAPDGGVAPDAGSGVSPDAGGAPPDAGAPPPDAGPAPPDAAPPPPDAALPPPDAALPPPDAAA